MKKTRIYTNGKSLFTLPNYGKTAGTSHVLGITLHSEVSIMKKQAMHSNGDLHYITGTGDRKQISNITLNRKMKFHNLEIS